MNASLSDRELVQRYSRGDGAAFGELVRRHQQLVYNLCLRVVGPTDAEDLMQEIFIRVMDKAQTWRGEAKFTTWLYRLSLNQCRDYLRRRRPEALEIDERAIDPRPGPATMAASHDDAEKIFSAMLGLSLDFRTIVFLRDVEGFSYEEISEILGIQRGTVKSRLARARAGLCKILEPIRPLEHQSR